MIIYHSNDVHGHQRELAELVYIAKERDPEAIWLDSGDALIGSNTVFRLHEPILDFMREAGCVAMAMGNREFNYLRRVMAKRQKQRNFPLLCANLRDLRRNELYWKCGISLQICAGSEGKYSLWITGVTPVQYPVGHFWESVFGFRFLEPLEVIPPLIYEARDRGQIPLILSHLGLDVDKILAKSLPAGTVILGGHTHTVLTEPVEVNGCWIVQSGSYGRYMGRLDYDLATRTLRSYELIKSYKNVK